MEAKKVKQAVSPQVLSDLNLDVDGVHAFRGVLAKVRWPVSHVVPELAYAVSSLAQVSPQALNWDHARQLKLVVRTLKKVNGEGKAKIALPKIDLQKVTVATAFDASFAKKDGFNRQAGFLSFLTTGEIAQGEIPFALV